MLHNKIKEILLKNSPEYNLNNFKQVYDFNVDYALKMFKKDRHSFIEAHDDYYYYYISNDYYTIKLEEDVEIKQYINESTEYNNLRVTTVIYRDEVLCVKIFKDVKEILHLIVESAFEEDLPYDLYLPLEKFDLMKLSPLLEAISNYREFIIDEDDNEDPSNFINYHEYGIFPARQYYINKLMIEESIFTLFTKYLIEFEQRYGSVRNIISIKVLIVENIIKYGNN